MLFVVTPIWICYWYDIMLWPCIILNISLETVKIAEVKENPFCVGWCRAYVIEFWSPKHLFLTDSAHGLQMNIGHSLTQSPYLLNVKSTYASSTMGMASSTRGQVVQAHFSVSSSSPEYGIHVIWSQVSCTRNYIILFRQTNHAC